ncbi:hypothetical protein, partial [Caballeronia arationis]|uniref:hypothetical protein n=1 Tax=Caballeronia arationis TaxID=1777142 RepID=UPI000AB4A7CA
VETLFFLPWNRHSLCRGIRVLFAVEFLFTLAWNIHPSSFWPKLRRKQAASILRVRGAADAAVVDYRGSSSSLVDTSDDGRWRGTGELHEPKRDVARRTVRCVFFPGLVAILEGSD